MPDTTNGKYAGSYRANLTVGGVGIDVQWDVRTDGAGKVTIRCATSRNKETIHTTLPASQFLLNKMTGATQPSPLCFAPSNEILRIKEAIASLLLL